MSVPAEQLNPNASAATNGGDGQSTDLELEGVLREAEASAKAETERLTGGAGAKDPAVDVDQGAGGAAPGQAFTISELNVQTIAMMLNSTFSIVATLRERPHWMISEAEADRAAVPLAAVANKYLGNMQLGPEWAAAFEVGQLVLIRVLADRELDKRAAGGAQ